jgi:hypothetical protein
MACLSKIIPGAKFFAPVYPAGVKEKPPAAYFVEVEVLSIEGAGRYRWHCMMRGNVRQPCAKWRKTLPKGALFIPPTEKLPAV